MSTIVDSWTKSSDAGRNQRGPTRLADLLAQGGTLYCDFDLDDTGEAMADAMITLHSSIQRLCLARKDWNDILPSQV